MKVRKLILLTLALTLICGSVAYADSISQKLRVWVNKNEEKEVDGASVLVGNKPYISAKLVADKLQAIVLWDDNEKKLTIYKPNVHMLTRKDSVIFGEVNKGSKLKFSIFAQVDSLKVKLSAYKWTISDPYGDETLIETRNSDDKDFPELGDDNFWINSKEISYTFESAGDYTIRFYMKPVGESSFQVVSEKVITSK
jgi:hypothetical protein